MVQLRAAMQHRAIGAPQVIYAGESQMDRIAEKLGISRDEASSGLAEMLPQIVDQLTPEGSLPTQDLLHQGLGMIADKLFGK